MAEDATATAGGTPISINIGVSRKPPPTPNTPDRNPIALPSPTARQLDARVIRSVQAGAFVLFQLDATAYPGHSGSPLYDSETGEVVGVVNMSIKATKDAAVGQATGISFAVPIKYVQELLRGIR